MPLPLWLLLAGAALEGGSAAAGAARESELAEKEGEGNILGAGAQTYGGGNISRQYRKRDPLAEGIGGAVTGGLKAYLLSSMLPAAAGASNGINPYTKAFENTLNSTALSPNMGLEYSPNFDELLRNIGK